LIKTKNALKAAKEGEVVIIVDTMTQVHNCIRIAEKLGWRATWEEKEDDFYISMKK
jgi:hypothetical protein